MPSSYPSLVDRFASLAVVASETAARLAAGVATDVELQDARERLNGVRSVLIQACERYQGERHRRGYKYL